MSESTDTSRTTVQTYVPAYQKERWQDHADGLDVSLSEFVRIMVQAGRKGFEGNREEPGSGDATPGGDALETRVLERLSEEPRSWDELLEALAGDLETRLEETLDRLQAEDRVRYSGRDGGYVVVDGETRGD